MIAGQKGLDYFKEYLDSLSQGYSTLFDTSETQKGNIETNTGKIGTLQTRVDNLPTTLSDYFLSSANLTDLNLEIDRIKDDITQL